MPANFTLNDCVALLNSEPNSDIIISEETFEVLDFDLKEAARLAGRELRLGAEFRPGKSKRYKMYVFVKKDET